MLMKYKRKASWFYFRKFSISAPLLFILVSAVANASSIKYDVSGSYRLRYETLHNPIFPTTRDERDKSNERISSQLLVKGQVAWNNFQVTAELADSRVFLDDNDPTLTSSQVNTLEPIQFFMRYTLPPNGGLKAVSIGRMTIDHGSRRLLAQAVYRNTKNSFDGVLLDWVWNNWDIRGFYLLPVSRNPSTSQALDNNERAFDKSVSERKIFGLYSTSPDDNVKLQSYWFKEDDSARLSTKNRDLFTLSVDYTWSIANTWKANVEVIGQTGTSHQTTSATDLTEKEVRGFMMHGAIEKQLKLATLLRAELDYISGDNDASDDTITNFDSLYGVRRFDFGPTDVYQAMPRRNLVAIGARSVNTAFDHHNLMVSYKAMWYEEAPESVDSFIGNQIEFRWRWQVKPNLRLALGGAYLKKGKGFERGDYSGDSRFLFTGARYTF